MIKYDKRNYRKHSDRNKNLIKKSLEECGAGRSIVIDNNDEIIAGNGLYEQAKKLGIKTKIIETDGSELVVVKRTDLATDDAKRKQLAVMDNSTSDSSEFDIELLQEDFELSELDDWGIDLTVDDVENLNNIDEESKYTRKISVPIYEIKGDCPKINDLFSTDKGDKLLLEIENKIKDEELKKFLKICCTRLYEFQYDKIAEFYAHQSVEIQEMFEKLALVIIDINKSIEYGYLQLNKFIEENFLNEYEVKND